MPHQAGKHCYTQANVLVETEVFTYFVFYLFTYLFVSTQLTPKKCITDWLINQLNNFTCQRLSSEPGSSSVSQDLHKKKLPLVLIIIHLNALYTHESYFKDLLEYYPLIYDLVFQEIPFFQVSPPKFYTHYCFLPSMTNALSVSASLNK
jgi:hypothetical protein